MHRMPLMLETPSYLWDRSAKDYELIPNALNNENYMEMIELMRKIEVEHNFFALDEERKAMSLYNNGLRALYDMEDEKEAVAYFNKGIVHASREGRALTLILRVRGETYHKLNRFESSTNDFELLLYLKKDFVKDPLLIYSKLVIGYYMLGKLDKAKEYYSILDKSAPKDPPPPTNPIERETEKLIYIADQLNYQMTGHSCTPGLLRKQPDHNAYSLLTSNANEVKGLYAKDDYPSDTVVLRERPLCKYLTLPWVQCELCLDMSRKMYCCFKCHLKTYCSVKCMRGDILHKDECRGIRYQLVIMLNCQNLFRSFVELIYLIQRNMLGRNTFSDLKKPSDILIAIRTQAKEYDIPLLKLLANEPDYTDLADATFSTILASSVRLSIFITERTNIMKKLEPQIETGPVENVIIVACLLMQLQYHLEKREMKIVYDVPRRSQTQKETFDVRKRLRHYCDRITPKDFLQDPISLYYRDEEFFLCEVLTRQLMDIEIDAPSPKLTPSPNRDAPIISPVIFRTEYALEYSDSIVNIVLGKKFKDDLALSVYISKMDPIERESFIDGYVKEFNRGIIDYYYGKRWNAEYEPVQQILHAACYDVQKFNHSCDPNVEMLFMDNGMIYVKTIKPVAKGEQCFISYKCHYSDYNIDTRKYILQKYGVECKCKYCLMQRNAEPIALLSNIYCVPKCYKVFNKMDKKCPSCDRKYETVMQEYISKIKIAEKDCNENSDRHIAQKHFYLRYRLLKLYFPCYNEFHMERRLQYAKYSAANNFFTMAKNEITDCYYQLKRYYADRKILFTHYLTLLEAVTLVNQRNMERSLRIGVESVSLSYINLVAITIIREQIAYLKNNGTYEKLCGQILPNYHLFLQWNEKLHYIDIKTITLESYLVTNPRLPNLTLC